jgi:DNA-binding PucR family transcriptional regulator
MTNALTLVRAGDVASLIRNFGSIARIVNSGKDPEDILNRIAYSMCHQSPWSSSAIMAIDRERRESIQIASFYPANHHLPQRWQLSRSPTNVVLRTGRPLVIADAKNDRKYIDYWTAAQVRHYRTVVLLPMNVVDEAGRPMILALHASHRLSLSAADLTYLSAIADLAGIAVEKGQRLRLERTINEQLGSLLALHRSLFAEALDDSSLESVLAVGRQFLNAPFIIADLTTGRILCGGFPEREDALAESLQTEHWPAVVELFRDLDAAKFAARALAPALAGRGSKPPKLIVEPVAIRGQTVGGLIVLSNGVSASEVAAASVGVIWMYLCIVLQRSHILLQGDSDAWSELISHLVSDDFAPSAAFAERAAERGFRADRPHRLLAVAGGDDPAATAIGWALAKVAHEAKPPLLHGMVEDCHILLIPGDDRRRDAAAAVARSALESIRRNVGRTPLVVAGEPCRSLADYPASWRRIRRILKWAQEAGLEGIVTAADAGSIALLADALDYKTTRRFALQMLQPILNYDATHGRPLLPTLDALLRSGGRLMSAAAELNVHITTMRYRKERMANLFGIDVDDPETRFRFDLALRLWRLIETGLAADAAAARQRPANS